VQSSQGDAAATAELFKLSVSVKIGFQFVNLEFN